MEAHRGRLEEKLVERLEEAHAIERGIAKELKAMTATMGEELRYPGVAELHPEAIIDELERHKQTTERHERLIAERLEALGASPRRGKDVKTVVGKLARGAAERAGGDRPAANTRRAFVNEQAEIALYEVLERLAWRAGDGETARLAAEIRSEEEAMAGRIAGFWDRALDSALAAEGLVEGPTRR